jgi:hypothetical protein
VTVLDRRALGRATLERQLLTRRHELPLVDAVEHLVGLQAQTTHTWYHGLWSRLRDFRPERLAELLVNREVVRVALMRSTIHLVTARDCLGLRPLVQVVIERSTNGSFGRYLKGLDLAPVVAAGRELLEQQPRTFSELGRALAERFPDRDPAALAQTVRAGAPLVQVPPRGVWGASGQSRHTTAESWLGKPLAPNPSVDDLVRRYLAAFGPASVRDVQAWSGLTRLREVADRLRPELVTFRDERGVELYDLPDAPRPDPATPVPVRYLYDYDNLLLSHADRSRFITPNYFQQGFTADGEMPRLILIDGVTAGLWKIARERGAATLTVRPFQPLSDGDAAALTDEGKDLLTFAEPNATSHDVQFLPPLP